MTSPSPVYRWLAALTVITAAAVSVLGLAVESSREATLTDPAGVARAVDVVRAGWRAGDVVWVEPAWDRSPWVGLHGMDEDTVSFPFSGLHAGDRPDPVDLLAHERLWVIGLHEREAAPPEAVASASRLVRTVPVDGGAEVALYALEGARPTARITDAIGVLRVRRRDPKGKITTCRKIGDRHDCLKQKWTDVRVESRDVFHRTVEWLYVHPGPGATALEVDWVDVPAGQTLLVRAGFSLRGIRKAHGTPTTLSVVVDDQPKASLTLAPHEYRLARALIELPPREAPYRVGFVVSAAGDPAYRQLMLQAETFSAVPDPIRRWVDADR